MKVKRRIEIITVREQIYRLPETSAKYRCQRCGPAACMVTTEIVACLFKLNLRTLFRWIESGDIHFLETAENHLFLCLDSVQAKVSSAEAQWAEREVIFSNGSCTTNTT